MTTEPRLLGGRYEIGEVVGYGGMAEVHRGRDLRLGRDVAVKLLRADLSRDESFLIRFQREAQNSASLNHPNIVAVFDTGEDAGIPYMVMEFVNGRTLKEVLLAEGRFDSAVACEVVADMCAALDFSHKHHIIHRDVKPGNVMLSDTNQVKVMDFGIARALASGPGDHDADQRGHRHRAVPLARSRPAARPWTPARTSTRSAASSTNCSWGTRRSPATTPVSVAYQHVREEARPPSELNPNVPDSVDAVIMKALAKNPENRYHSAGEMREDLIRAARGQAVMAPAVMSAGDRTQLLAGGADSTAPITPIATSSSKRRPWLIAMGVILALVAVTAAAWGIMKMLETSATVPCRTWSGSSRRTRRMRSKPRASSSNAKYEVAEDPTDTAIGTVTEQDPANGDEVDKGETVRITVLQKPENVSIEDVVGDDFEDAKKTLEDQNLKVKKVETESPAPPGRS